MSAFAETHGPVERLSDERLIALVGEGNERAFEELAQRYRGPLLRYCRRLSLSQVAAEDALQEALAETWMTLRRGTPVREPKAWLYRVAHNSAVDVARRAARERDRGCEVGSQPELASEGGLEHALKSRETLEALASLPVLQREAIMRSAVEGVSHEQVASDLGLSAGAVRGLIYRARATLRRAVGGLIPPPALAWITRTDAGVGASGDSAGLAETLVRGAAVAVTAGLVAGVVATHGGRPASPHRTTPLTTKVAANRSAVRDARPKARPGTSPTVGARDRMRGPGAAGKPGARPGRPAEARRASRPGTSKPAVVKAARGDRARSASPGVATAPAAAAPAAAAAAGHGDPTSTLVTGGRAGTGAVSRPGSRAPGTNPTGKPGPSAAAQQATGTTMSNGARAAGALPETAHAAGETVHTDRETVGNTVHGTGEAVGNTVHGAGEAVGNTVHGAGEAVGNTVHTAGEAVANTVHAAGQAVGETVHAAGQAVGETVHAAGAAVANTVHAAGAAVGETVHAAGAAVGETVHTAGAAVGETVHTAGKAAGETVQTAGKAVGENVHTAGKAVGETVPTAGGAVEDGDVAGQTGAVVGETVHGVDEAVHHVAEPAGGLGETVRSVGGLLGAP